jgi:4-amino-4-deoxy-L-arabinose transferase-like glycosyltransferase
MLLNLMLAGVFLRLATLAAWPLWLDEGATWIAATKPTWEGTLLAEANHPPLWWLVTRAWIGVFGDGAFALRAPAAILGVLSIWLAWCVLLRVLDPERMPSRGGFDRRPDGGRGRRIAAWTTGLVAVLTYFVEYSQEARMYPLLLALALGMTLVYLRWLDGNTKGNLVLYAALATLALYTHYFGFLIPAGHAVHALWVFRKGERRRALPFLGAVAVAGLLFVPWFVYLLAHYGGIGRARPEPFSTLAYVLWRVGVGPAILATSPERAAVGGLRVALDHLPTALATAVLWILPVLLGIRAVFRRPGLRSLVATTLLLPVAFVLAVYPFFALIHERYFQFVAPWVVLLAVLGAFSLPRVLRWASLGGLALLAFAGAVAYHGASPWLLAEGRAGTLDGAEIPARFGPDPENPITRLSDGQPYGREPWRTVHDFVRSHAETGDLVAIHAWYMDYVWRYYARHDAEGRKPLDVLLLPQYEWSSTKTLKEYGETLRHRDRVFLVLSHEETPDPDHWGRALAAAVAATWREEGAAGFHRIGPVAFPQGIRVVLFVRQ